MVKSSTVGFICWGILHTLNKNKKNWKHICSVLRILQFLYPCKYCRYSILRFLRFFPPEKIDENDYDLQKKYLYNMHSIVNIKLKKTNFISFEEYEERLNIWENFVSNKNINVLFQILNNETKLKDTDLKEKDKQLLKYYNDIKKILYEKFKQIIILAYDNEKKV